MDNINYYEQFDWAKANLAEKLIEKIIVIKKNIPKDVFTIIDIGCGNGIISNSLNDEFNIYAVDRSRNALQYVKTKKILSSADNLGISSNTFDLVLSSEMLEHLAEDIFIRAINELKRISKKYIFITVPNDENIRKKLAKCPSCDMIFNTVYHLRRINLDLIKSLFPEYHVIKSFTFGNKMRDYSQFLEKIKHKFSPASSWIPNYWTKDGRRATMCPSCSTKFDIPYKFHPIGFICDVLNVLVSKKKMNQLFVLLEKIK